MKLYLLLPFLFTMFVAIGQSDDPKLNKVIEVYGEDYTKELKSSNPGKLDLLIKYASSGFIVLAGNIKIKAVAEINSIPLHEKGKTLAIDEFLAILQNENYNPLRFEWIPSIQPQTYKLGKTDYFICVPSQKQL